MPNHYFPYLTIDRLICWHSEGCFSLSLIRILNQSFQTFSLCIYSSCDCYGTLANSLEHTRNSWSTSAWFAMYTESATYNRPTLKVKITPNEAYLPLLIFSWRTPKKLLRTPKFPRTEFETKPHIQYSITLAGHCVYSVLLGFLHIHAH